MSWVDSPPRFSFLTVRGRIAHRHKTFNRHAEDERPDLNALAAFELPFLAESYAVKKRAVGAIEVSEE